MKQRVAQRDDRRGAGDGAQSRLIGASVSAYTRRVANLRHRAPVDALATHTTSKPPAGHRIEPCVGRRVRRLPGRAQQPRLQQLRAGLRALHKSGGVELPVNASGADWVEDDQLVGGRVELHAQAAQVGLHPGNCHLKVNDEIRSGSSSII